MNDLHDGQHLGRHHLIAQLARGGMGIVWLARSEGPFGFEKLAVVKELKPALASDPVYREMFLEEARLAARLDHPNIVQTHEVGCEGERLFMTLELLEGCSLHDAKKKIEGGIPVRLALRVLSDVLAALHYAHEQGVVHRDVSGQNVFLTYDGRVKLLDFGVAKTRGSGRPETKVGVLKGSIPYMSPDHADGGTIDRRADVFAVGVHLRELITGERLWGDLDDVSVLRKLVTRELPAFPTDSRIPQALRAIAERAMAPRRGDRYTTALEMRDAIEDYLAETGRGCAPSRQGTLAELGVMLERSLSGERAAFRALVKCHKSAIGTQTAFAATVPSAQDPISLPSDDLVTDPSGAQPRAKRRSPAGLVAIVAAGALALAAGLFGLTSSVPVPAAVAALPPPPVSAPASLSPSPASEPAPSVVAQAIATAASPSALGDAPPEPVEAAAEEPELPPNPYAPPSPMQLTR